MFNSAVIVLFYVVLGSTLALGILNWFRSSLSDIRQTKLHREWMRHPNAKSFRRRPLVSVVVFASNDESTVMDCLHSLFANSYRKTEVIIIDNASTDDTKSMIKEYIRAYPKKSLRLIAKKRPASRADALAAVARQTKGELVITLDASTVVGRTAIKNLVLHMSDPDIEAVLPNVWIDPAYKLLGLANKMRSINTIWSRKSGSYISSTLDANNYAALYRRANFLNLAKPKNRASLDNINALRSQLSRVAYEGQAVIKTYKSAVKQPRAYGANFWQFSRNLIAWLEPILAIFMLYVAFRFNNASYILLAWLSFSVLLLLAIWSDESRSLTAKIRASVLAVIGYSLYILQSLIRLLQSFIDLMALRYRRV